MRVIYLSPPTPFILPPLSPVLLFLIPLNQLSRLCLFSFFCGPESFTSVTGAWARAYVRDYEYLTSGYTIEKNVYPPTHSSLSLSVDPH